MWNCIQTELDLKYWVADTRDPRVSDVKTEPAALLDGRGQNSTATSSPAVTSSPDLLLDLARWLVYLAGPIVDTNDDGSGHGGSARRNVGGTPVGATKARPKARTSTSYLKRTRRTS